MMKKQQHKFKTGYVFGKRLDGTYILSKCEPLNNCRFGIVEYEYGNSAYLRITPHELEMLNEGNTQWVEHYHQIGNDSTLCFADTIGEAIESYRNIEELPYMASESEMEAMTNDFNTPLYLMTVDELNEKLKDENLDEILMYSEVRDDLVYLNE